MKLTGISLILLVLGSQVFAQDVIVVKALPGDTVERIAIRYGADPIEIAKYNGLLPNSILGPGREIKLLIQCYSTTPVDLTTSKLPANFGGYDLKRVVSALDRRRFMSKDEFETTPQFLERRRQEEAKPLLGSLDSVSLFVFEVPATFRYDADSAEMHVTYDLSDKSRATCGGYRILSDHYLNFEENISSRVPKAVWSSRFPISIEQARVIKPKLRLLAVVVLRNINGSYLTQERRSSEVGLNADLRELWIYEFETGTIISKNKVNVKGLSDSGNTAHAIEIANAKKFLTSGDFEAALLIARKILVEEPMNGEAYLILGKIHTRRGDLDQAVSALKTALFWDDKLVDGHLGLGKIYLQKGDCVLARSYAISAGAIEPENKEVVSLKQLTALCSR